MDGVFVHWTESRLDHNTWGTSWKIKWDDDRQILILMILTQTTDLQGISPWKFFLSSRRFLQNCWSLHPIRIAVHPFSCPRIFSWMERIYTKKFTKVSRESEVEEMSWWWRDINPGVSRLCAGTNNSWITSLISNNINSSAKMSTFILPCIDLPWDTL